MYFQWLFTVISMIFQCNRQREPVLSETAWQWIIMVWVNSMFFLWFFTVISVNILNITTKNTNDWQKICIFSLFIRHLTDPCELHRPVDKQVCTPNEVSTSGYDWTANEPRRAYGTQTCLRSVQHWRGQSSKNGPGWGSNSSPYRWTTNGLYPRPLGPCANYNNLII